jgi:hypothetical protein
MGVSGALSDLGMFIIAGPLYLIIKVVKDTINFIIDLFTSQSVPIDDFQYLDMELFSKLEQML